MMVFSYFDREEREGIVSTNLKSISEQTGINYHTLANWFRNGNMVHTTEEHIIFKTEVIRGKQRVKWQ
jgi:predicted site-specific integrase-resolvase